MGNVIEGTVCVKTEDMKLVENYLKISGKALFKILYMTASLDPQPAVLEGKLPFEEMVYVEQPGEEEYFLKNLRTEFSVSMVHSRKLSLHLLTELEIGRTQMISEEVTEDVESEHAVYKKMKKFIRSSNVPSIPRIRISPSSSMRISTSVFRKNRMKLVKNQKGAVQDCAVVLFGVCEECLKKQAAQ